MPQIVKVVKDGAGKRLDQFLALHIKNLSRSRIQGLIQGGYVTVSGVPLKSSAKLTGVKTVEVVIPDPTTGKIESQNIPIEVVYEDEYLIVVNKPPGLVVHPGPGHSDGTLVNAILDKCPDLKGIGGSIRPGIVHRLDKDTSGLIVIAKDEYSHRKISDQLKNRSVTKRYLALVKGSLENSEAIIDAPIGRDPDNRLKMAIVENGKNAVTQYRVISRFKSCDLLDVTIKTGRTHQIRVHMSSIGHPVMGDHVYKGSVAGLSRQFLHASELEFTHPILDKDITFNSDLPEDLSSFISLLV
jgi:23S rRNA pseudouridine1911/1915/1917 synthase